ncbi:hypothetical protein OKW38_000403 [Paraburkholderia sp. MM5496-R1]
MLAHRAFVGWIAITVQQAHCHTREFSNANRRNDPLEAIEVERHELVALRVHAAAHGEAVAARHERLGQCDAQVVLLKAAFGAHLDDVAKAFARDEGGARAAPFDQGIGGERGAVNDRSDLRGFDRRLGRRTPQSFDNRAFRLFVISQNLGRVESVAVLQCDVRKRAANVDTRPNRLFSVMHARLSYCEYAGVRQEARRGLSLVRLIFAIRESKDKQENNSARTSQACCG